MKARYLFSSSKGDVPLDEKTLDRAFLVNPFDAHPFLKLRDYFQAIERFIQDRLGVLLEKSKAALPLDRLSEILIRSEKHGTLYHVASVELPGDGPKTKFAISTAFSEPRIKALLQEFGTMGFLNRKFRYPYLPRVYLAEEAPCSNPRGTETVGMCVSEWLEGYHEWHLTVDQNGKQSLLVWDTEKGNRRASKKENQALFREASRILTLYYDAKTYRQIYPWHHAAGDFVVKSVGKTVEVRLTTARNYLPLISFPEKADTNRLTALVAFLLNMSVQMRLDRIEGVGEPLWAQEEVVRPCLEGFFGALQTMKAQGRCAWGGGPDPATLLKKFSQEEFQRLYAPLMESYRREKPSDFKVVEANLEAHIAALSRALQGNRFAS